jgi:hypothetical protein
MLRFVNNICLCKIFIRKHCLNQLQKLGGDRFVEQKQEKDLTFEDAEGMKQKM